MIHSFFFEEIGFNPYEYHADTARKECIQLVCDHLMDTVYCEFNEEDVINHSDIVIDWKTGTVIVPCKQVYKPEYLH